MLAVLVAFSLLGCGVCGVNVSPDMRSFSSAIKGGLLAKNSEKVLYEHNTGQPGVITEQWFTGEYAVTPPIPAWFLVLVYYALRLR